MFTSEEVKKIDTYCSLYNAAIIYKPFNCFVIDSPDSDFNRMTKTEMLETMTGDLSAWGYFFKHDYMTKPLKKCIVYTSKKEGRA